jgi:multimeric flavodoxin WrbA
MRVMSVLGSPRRKGNTAKVLGWVEEELVALGHEVDHVNLIDFEVSGCLGCYACKASLDTPCVQRDDGNALFSRVVRSDGLILASPLYCWGFSAQMKAFLDRAICLVVEFKGADHQSRLEGKRLALVATGEGPLERNLDLLQTPFDLLCEYSKATNAGSLLVPGCKTPDAIAAEVRDRAMALARAIGG